MAGQFIENFRILVAKAEDTPGTMVTPTSADFKQKIRAISVSPSVDMDPNKYQTGHHGEADAVSGKQFGTVSFEVLMAWGGAVTTAPNYAIFDYACGQYPHTYAGTGFATTPLKAYDEKTITIWVYDIQAGATPGAICYKFAGCVGNRTEGADGVGKPLMRKYTFTGKLVDIDFNVAYADIPVLADMDATCTDKALLTTVTIDSVERIVSSFSLDCGNEVTALEDMSDATGISHYSITKRSPKLTVNPLFKLAQDDYGYLNSGATGCADTMPVIISGNHFTITVPKARLSAGTVSSRDGRVGMDMTFDCLFNGVTGAYADTGMLGDSGILGEATYEDLIGSRS